MATGDKIPVEAIKKALAENPVLKWAAIGLVAIFAVEFLAKEAMSIGREIATWNDVTNATKEKARAEALQACWNQYSMVDAKINCRKYLGPNAHATDPLPQARSEARQDEARAEQKPAAAKTNDWARRRNAGIMAGLVSAIVIAAVRGQVKTQGIIALCGVAAILGVSWLVYQSAPEAWLGEEFGVGMWVDVGTSLVTSGALLICAVTVIGAGWHTLRRKTG